jgi:hypothetical protein
MAQFVSVNRYRMVDLQTGKILVVFLARPGAGTLDSCRQACREMDVDPGVGEFRIDRMKQDRKTKTFKWVRIYRFALEQD